MAVINVYSLPQVVQLTSGTYGAPLMNYPVNRTDFNVIRNLDNEIDFIVKDVDRKVVNMANATLTINIVNPETTELLLERTLTLLDASQGMFRLALTGDEAASFPKAPPLSYTVTHTRADHKTVMLYTDRNYHGSGKIGVFDGPVPDPLDPIALTLSDFIQTSGIYYCSALLGAANVGNTSGQHSVAINFSSFSGVVAVQGSLAATPLSSSDWFTVVSNTYTAETSLTHVAFNANLLWVRFAITITSGTITSLSYRN